MIAGVTTHAHAVGLLPDLVAHVPARGKLHALADAYEQWLVLQQLAERTIGRSEIKSGSDLPLTRKAYAIGREAESKLMSLRIELSSLPAANHGELARKARIVLFDASSWLDEGDDPLFASFCDDTLRLSGWEAIAAPTLVPGEAFQRLAALDWDAPPLPWEDQL